MLIHPVVFLYHVFAQGHISGVDIFNVVPVSRQHKHAHIHTVVH